MVLARGFGRLTSAAYQPSGGPLPQYPSSCPRGHAWSQRELDVRALIEGLANDWNFRRVPPGRRRQRTRALRPQRKREGFRLEGFLDPIECLCCGAAAEDFVSGFSVKDGCKQHSHDNLQMSRAGGSDRLGRDGLSHPGDRHLPGGAKADATEARVPTDTGAARADRRYTRTLRRLPLVGPPSRRYGVAVKADRYTGRTLRLLGHPANKGPPCLRRLLRRMGGRLGLMDIWRVVMVLILRRWPAGWSVGAAAGVGSPGRSGGVNYCSHVRRRRRPPFTTQPHPGSHLAVLASAALIACPCGPTRIVGQRTDR
jgi:hypothetical protein